MKQEPNWEDLKLFASVARAGGLAGAAARTGVSPATLGRRVEALETALDLRLVERGARGYRLTAAGGELLAHIQDMEHAVEGVMAWRAGSGVRRRVRISAGEWTMALLSGHLDRFWTPVSRWSPEFLADMRSRDIAHRQIDIGIRNSRPQQPWLAGQKVGTVEFAPYRAAHLAGSEDPGWIGLVDEDGLTPTGVWLQEEHGARFSLTVNKAVHALPLVRQGAGCMLLPTFVGDAFADLVRISDPVEHLTTGRWLVMHQDGRHEPAVRTALKALSAFLKTAPVMSAGMWINPGSGSIPAQS